MSSHEEQPLPADPDIAAATPAERREAPPRADTERAQTPPVSLDRHRLLGRSGLRVSPLALGTMTFGAEWGWGAERKEAQRMFDAYVDRGGNFIDSAGTYTDGTAERFVGEFAAGRRDRLVIATKYSEATRADDPNSGGNHRKSMVASVERSLRALQTDYVDLLYMHYWDGATPAEEVLRAMDDLIRAGKVLCVGICATPAWQVSRMQAIAELRGWAQLAALQIERSLIEREGEHELMPMARELGIAMIACSPLAGGVLSGKYSQADLTHAVAAEATGTRRSLAAATGALSERGLAIAEAVGEIAAELGTSAARVALAWALLDQQVTASIIGARTLAQLEEDLGALELELSASHRERLDAVSASGAGRRERLSTRMTIAGPMRAARAGTRVGAG